MESKQPIKFKSVNGSQLATTCCRDRLHDDKQTDLAPHSCFTRVGYTCTYNNDAGQGKYKNTIVIENDPG